MRKDKWFQISITENYRKSDWSISTIAVVQCTYVAFIISYSLSQVANLKLKYPTHPTQYLHWQKIFSAPTDPAGPPSYSLCSRLVGQLFQLLFDNCFKSRLWTPPSASVQRFAKPLSFLESWLSSIRLRPFDERLDLIKLKQKFDSGLAKKEREN